MRKRREKTPWQPKYFQFKVQPFQLVDSLKPSRKSKEGNSFFPKKNTFCYGDAVDFRSINPLKCKHQNSRKFLFSSFLKDIKSQMVPCKNTASKVSLEWSHHRISSIDLNYNTGLHNRLLE